MARKKQFKAESKRLLDLMINSIYTNKEIFLRELISNASDALDKLYFKSLKEGDIELNRDDLKIEVWAEDDKLYISDNGIGMDEKELGEYLGTIAKSDSFNFKQDMDESEIIGQFGVGFYSAFMVSDNVQVISKKYGADQAFVFESSGLDGYTITEAEREDHGSTIICSIKENTEDVDYAQYLETHTLRHLIKTYSDYIQYPIVLKYESYEDKGEIESETINTMIPLWKRSKADLNEGDLENFYKEKFTDMEDPLKTIQLKVEGVPSFDALLYIPKRIPMNFYSSQYETGLQLYSRSVFIMEHNKDLLPEHFRFVRGLVDSPDLSLNISREILQNDPQIKVISKRIERKIQSELELMLKNDREGYELFWESFGNTLKYGVYNQFGMHKEKLQDLLLFNSSKGGLVTLSEYVENMKEDQAQIYYVVADSIEKAQHLPITEFVLSKGYEILYLVDEIDEFAISILHEYEGKDFKSITQGDLDLMDEEEKDTLESKKEDHKDLLAALEKALKDKVDKVQLSSRLVNHPVSLVSDEGMSLEMEKILSQMPDANNVPKATRILEINPNHELLDALKKVYSKDEVKIAEFASLLYDQACLIEGLKLEDPVAFSQNMARLMVEASKV